MSLSREKVLAAALEIADRDGLGGLQMRKLGAALDVEAMSLYRYVANKSDLLDGLFEAVAAEVKLAGPTGDWVADTRRAGRGLFAALNRHPNLLPLFVSRPAVTPASLETLETALEILGQEGADVARCLAMFNVLFSYILGFAMLQVQDEGSDAFVDYSALNAQTHPRLSGLNQVLAAYDANVEFERGLDAVIAGLAATSTAAGR